MIDGVTAHEASPKEIPRLGQNPIDRRLVAFSLAI
jgi:hypothetical protein